MDTKINVSNLATSDGDLSKIAKGIFEKSYNARRANLLKKYPEMSDRMPELEIYLKDAVRKDCHETAVAWIEGALLAHKHTPE